MLLTTFLLLSLHAGAGQGSAAELNSRFEDFIERRADQGEFSGAVLLARGDQVVLRRAFGLASLRYDVPNEPDTKFAMGSMNKMFTGVGICQLVEQGFLSFESTIGDVLPDYPNRAAHEITVHQLLTHTSGIPSYWNAKYEERWKTLRSVQSLIDLFADEPLRFEPGSSYEYSNGGPTVLGRMIEVLSKKDYFTFVRDHVTGPAGMRSTDFYEVERSVPNLAMGYTRTRHDGTSGDEWLENTLVHTVRGGPAGGCYTTVDDMLRFGRALQDGKLLSPEMTRTMLDGAHGAELQDGYLIARQARGGYVEYGHNGGAPGVSADFGFIPALDLTFVVLSNQDAAAFPVSDHLRELIAELGVAPAPLGVELSVADTRITVAQVTPGSPAEVAGQRTGDQIISVAGVSAAGPGFPERLVQELRSGVALQLRIRRAGQTLEIVIPERKQQ